MKKFIPVFMIVSSVILSTGNQSRAQNSKFNGDGVHSFISRDNFNRLINLAINSSSFSDGKGNIEGEFSFFSLKSIFTPQDDYIDTEYLKPSNRRLRSISIGLTGTLKENGAEFESFKPSIQWTILNNRDLKKSELNQLKQLTATNSRVFSDLGSALRNGGTEVQKIYNEIRKLGNPIKWGKVDFSEYKNNQVFQDILKKVAQQNNVPVSVFTSPFDALSRLVELASRRSLLTFSWSSSSGNVKTDTETAELKWTGAINQDPTKVDSKPWDYELLAQYLVKNDTTNEVPINNGRKTLSFALNSNNVLMSNDQGESTLEFKLGTEFTNIIEGILPEEKRNTFTFNAVLTPKLSKDLYAPISLKYDPENSNILGFFSLSWNIGDKKK